MYGRLIKDLKKTLYKTLGRTHLQYEQLKAVIMDIERHLNNRPLTYVESESGEEQVLTPNIIMWGRDSHAFEDVEVDEERVTKMYKRLKNAREHVWSRWNKEYINSLMEVHRINRKKNACPFSRHGIRIRTYGQNLCLSSQDTAVRDTAFLDCYHIRSCLSTFEAV